jgi:exocyst complex component 6
MCQTSISLVSSALNAVDNAEDLLRIKGVIALFIQTMDVRKASVQVGNVLSVMTV